MSVFCLVVTKGRLDDYMRDVLFLGAARLFRDRAERRDLKADRCEGFVRTRFMSASLGGICGTKFAAYLDADIGRVEVSYIVREADLDEEITRQENFDRIQNDGLSPWNVRGLRFTDDELETFHEIPPAAALLH